ncbi:hypothetical protein QVD17_00666 [Tagetes erecta]|uniref:Uncharacterized protein n=1 Tax=Tagetes erecta TaxID=13708 RepID=A0AAD8P7L0_TARER|nr:hypothetical protein QVD17_00666 [Tagetes erecta]
MFIFHFHFHFLIVCLACNILECNRSMKVLCYIFLLLTMIHKVVMQMIPLVPSNSYYLPNTIHVFMRIL